MATYPKPKLHPEFNVIDFKDKDEFTDTGNNDTLQIKPPIEDNGFLFYDTTDDSLNTSNKLKFDDVTGAVVVGNNDATSRLDVQGVLTTSGAATMTSTLNVSGASTFNNSLIVESDNFKTLLTNGNVGSCSQILDYPLAIFSKKGLDNTSIAAIAFTDNAGVSNVTPSADIVYRRLASGGRGELNVNLITSSQKENVMKLGVTASTFSKNLICSSSITTTSLLASQNVVASNITATSNIIANQNIGISTTNPLSKLSIDPMNGGAKVTFFDGGSTTTHCGISIADGNMCYEVPLTTNGHSFRSAAKNGTGNELMRITGDGKVGIGTSSITSTATLQVSGLTIFNNGFWNQSGATFKDSIVLETGGTTNKPFFRIQSSNYDNLINTGPVTGCSVTNVYPIQIQARNGINNETRAAIAFSDQLSNTLPPEVDISYVKTGPGLNPNSSIGELNINVTTGLNRLNVAKFDGKQVNFNRNVGINVPGSATNSLQVSGASFFDSVTVGSTLRVNSSFNVQNSMLIGASGTSPSSLTINPTLTGPKITLWNGGDQSNHFGFSVSDNQLNYHAMAGSQHIFWNNGLNGTGNELMRLFYSVPNNRPQVGIGMLAENYQFQLNFNSAAKPSSSSWTIDSDERLKADIQFADLDLCYNNVKKIPLKRFKWKDEIFSAEQVIDRTNLGWIAQDVEPVFPKAVTRARRHGISDCCDLDVDQLNRCLYGAVQKLMQKVESLEEEMQTMKTGSTIN